MPYRRTRASDNRTQPISQGAYLSHCHVVRGWPRLSEEVVDAVDAHTARTARGAGFVNETARRSVNRAAAQTWAFTNCGLAMADVTSLPSCCHSAKLWSLVLVGNWMVDASSSRQYVLLVKDMFIKPDGIVAMSMVPLG